jgi:hypothetical protein
MDQKLFEQRLTEVCEWQRVSFDSDKKWHRDRDEDKLSTYIKINKLKEQPCEYDSSRTGCNISIRLVQHTGFYMTYCRSCRHLIYKGQRYDTQGQPNLVYLYSKIIKQNK